jgi:Rrf2 family iron-sulfur cluster assembly transcriptional regulator
MLLTTKARYAIMAMIDIAQQRSLTVSLNEIAERQSITVGYLEQIFSKLKKAEIITSSKGPGGGYKLSKNADEIKLVEVIKAVEENIRMTKCGEIPSCMIKGVKCSTHYLWKGLERTIENYFTGITIKDAIELSINGPQIYGKKNV